MTVVSVGAGGDYAGVQAAINAATLPLTEIYEMQIRSDYVQSQDAAGIVFPSGASQTSSNYFKLTYAPGNRATSFTQGARIEVSGLADNVHLIEAANANWLWIDGVAIVNNSTNFSHAVSCATSRNNIFLFTNSFIKAVGNGSSDAIYVPDRHYLGMINCVVRGGEYTVDCGGDGYFAEFAYCTFVNSAGSNSGVRNRGSQGSHDLANCISVLNPNQDWRTQNSGGDTGNAICSEDTSANDFTGTNYPSCNVGSGAGNEPASQGIWFKDSANDDYDLEGETANTITQNGVVVGVTFEDPRVTSALWANDILDRVRSSNGSIGAYTFTSGGPDTDPDPYSLGPNLSNQPVSTVVLSSTDTISGINAAAPVSIAGTGSPEYSVNGGAWTSAPGTINNGETIQARNRTPLTRNQSVQATVTIGTVDNTNAPWVVATETITLTNPTGTATGTTTANISVTPSVNEGTIWWIVSEDNTQPSHAQIKAGQDGTGATAKQSGSIAAPFTFPIAVTGLDSRTTYYAWFTQEDAAGTEAVGQVGSPGFTTTDANPAFTTGPAVTFQTSTTAGIEATVADDSGVADHYCTVYAQGSTPTNTDIKNGATGGNGGAGFAWGGNVLGWTSGVLRSWTASGLTAGTAYEVHYLAEDDQAQQTKGNVVGFSTTTADPLITSINGGQVVQNRQGVVVVIGENFGTQGPNSAPILNGIDLTANIISWSATQVEMSWPDLPEDPRFVNMGFATSQTLVIRRDDLSGTAGSDNVTTGPEADAIFGQMAGVPAANSIFADDTYVAGDDFYGKWILWNGATPSAGDGSAVIWQTEAGTGRLTGIIGDTAQSGSGIAPNSQLRYRIFDGSWSNPAEAGDPIGEQPEDFQSTATAAINDINSGAGIVDKSTGNSINGSNLQGANTGDNPANVLQDQNGTRFAYTNVVSVSGAQLTFTAPSMVAGNLKFGSGLLELSGTGGGYPLQQGTFFTPEAGWAVVDISDAGVDLPVVTGDQVYYKTTTNEGGFAVSINSSANVVVQSNGSLVAQTFDYYIYTNSANTWGALQQFNWQETAPTLSSPAATNGETTISGTITTDKYGQVAGYADGGTLYCSVFAQSTTDPGHDAIKNGVGALGSGAVNVPADAATKAFPNITGLTGSTPYEVFYTQEDAAGNPSTNRPTQSVTTDAPPVGKPVRSGTDIANQTNFETDTVNLDIRPAWNATPTVDSYSLSGGPLPAGLVLQPGSTGLITGDVTAAPGTYPGLEVTAANAGGSTPSNQFGWTIQSSAPNWIGPDVPAANGQVGVAITPVDFSTRFSVPASVDQVANPTTYIINGFPPGLVIDANGIVSGTPTQEGSWPSGTVTATNVYGADQSSATSFTIAPSGQLPIWSTVTSQGHLEQRPLTFNFGSFVAGADTYSSTSLPTGLSIPDPNLPEVTGTPTTPGIYQVTLTATNTAGPENSNQFQWTIADDAAPTLNVPNNLTVAFAAPATGVPKTDPNVVAWLASATASDPEDGDLTSSITNDSATSLPAELTPAGSPYTVTWTVQDAIGQQTQATAQVSAVLVEVPTDTPKEPEQAISVGIRQ